MTRRKRTAVTEALAMLARRDHSRARLRAKLLARGHPREAVDEALDQCAGYGYLDDHRFGRSRLETRLARRPAGRRDALRDLQRQGLTATMSESVADEVFDEAGGEAAVLEDAFERWVARHGEPQDIAAAKRCFDHLMRRTFPRHLVLQKLSPWLDEIAS